MIPLQHVGMSMMAQAVMSAAYHMCPTRDSFRFDSTFMYVMTGLGVHKLLQSRCPDKNPGLHEIMLILSAIVVSVVVGTVSGPCALVKGVCFFQSVWSKYIKLL